VRRRYSCHRGQRRAGQRHALARRRGYPIPVQPTADPPTSALTGGDVDIRPGMALPLPDDAAALTARDRLASIDIGVSAPTVTALGMLADPVVFIAGVQGSPYPRPLLSTRVVLVTGSHSGGVVAGPSPDPRNGTPLAHLAVTAGAGIVTLEWHPASAAIEFEDAITAEQMDSALRAGWAEADRAADEGIEVLVIAAGGAGSATAAAAVVSAVTGAEPTALLARVVTPAGRYDDNAWMTRCLTLRDALHRVRNRDGDPRTVLSALGGADIAAATGLILGAASRRTPVMIDGPVGAAAALLASDFSPQARRWVLLPDTGRHMVVRFAAEALELRPWLDLCLDLGEGATALAALPMLQTALTLAGVGEPVAPRPLTRLDSTGNQVFVGVARAIKPSRAATEDPSGGTASDAAATVFPDHGRTEPGTAAKSPVEEVEPTVDMPVPVAQAAPAAAPAAEPAVEVPVPVAKAAPTAEPAVEVPVPVAKAAPAAEPAVEVPVPVAKAAPVAGAAKASQNKTGPQKAVPAKPAKVAPAKSSPANHAPTKEAPAKQASAKPAPPRGVSPTKAAQARPAPAKEPAAKELPAKDPAAKESPARQPARAAPKEPAKNPPATASDNEGVPEPDVATPAAAANEEREREPVGAAAVPAHAAASARTTHTPTRPRKRS